MPEARYIPTDRFEELNLIDLDGVFGVLDVYCDNFLPDMEACQVFLARILGTPGASTHPATRPRVAALLRKALAFGPFHLPTMEIAHNLTGNAELGERIRKLRSLALDSSLSDPRALMSDEGLFLRKRNKLLDMLEDKPGHVTAASHLLYLDACRGLASDQWLARFTVPKFVRTQWERRLLLHYAATGETDRALALWPGVAQGPICEVELNCAAELFAASGDRDRAATCYARSLEIDPAQTPARLRLVELHSPTLADANLPAQRDVTICLYSWNKAEDLKRTLASLAETNLGRARIRVLLNGCTDDSAQVAEAARTHFPERDYAVLALPVNVGAPAARNWLGALPEARASQFVAYIDDDVELPEDWLAHFLTVMERHPNTAVVGCKVVFGADPRMVQYLYRAFALARPEIIKLTDPCQVAQMDRGHYDFVRETDTVMGCCHLLRTACMPDGPDFDLRYSPTQVDDTAHDLTLRLQGHEVRYCGLVRCRHHQNTGGGFRRQMTDAQLGQALGNDMKFHYFFKAHLERIKAIMANAART
ncbi:glycosyltransferase [Pseudodesulfovibrio sp. F-1]|uniref:Glycosyltransferase n=1 Tax=Pseudodesulfovibrio alkaliphilus TaxID=2661613 RepID=A0A7K1KJB7_9BACT|nr:glycosyltransferase family A protein [Pseudodesulfovibrio alkaliphilus]MUM76110.1 glycosyltransferase [Pseudodesulfovibrio alkaliphilus]